MIRQLSSRASTLWDKSTNTEYGQGYNSDNTYKIEKEGRLHLVIPDPSETRSSEDFRDILDSDDFKRAEDQLFLDALEYQDSSIRVENTAPPIQNPFVRVIDFASPENTERARSLDSLHLIERTEDVKRRSVDGRYRNSLSRNHLF